MLLDPAGLARASLVSSGWSSHDPHPSWPCSSTLRASLVPRSCPRAGRRMTRILVVEDEVSFSDPLSYLLRKEGYEVAVAETGTEALEDFDRAGADLVLLDLMLPGLSGTEV